MVWPSLAFKKVLEAWGGGGGGGRGERNLQHLGSWLTGSGKILFLRKERNIKEVCTSRKYVLLEKQGITQGKP